MLGFNISTVGQNRSSKAGQSTAALVASINPDFTKYFSCVVEQDAGQNLSPLLGSKLKQALDAYERTNGMLPQRIIFYRDGVGEGQLKAITDLEVEALNVKDFTFQKSLMFVIVQKICFVGGNQNEI